MNILSFLFSSFTLISVFPVVLIYVFTRQLIAYITGVGARRSLREWDAGIAIASAPDAAPQRLFRLSGLRFLRRPKPARCVAKIRLCHTERCAANAIFLNTLFSVSSLQQPHTYGDPCVKSIFTV